MRKTLVAAAAAIAVASGAMIGQAAAADLDFAPAPAPPPFIPTWAGFYIGGHVGYGEADFDVRQEIDIFEFDELTGDFEPGIFNTFERTVSPDGLLGGVQGGYNWQVNSLVFGIEGDISFTDWQHNEVVFNTEDGDVDGTLPREVAWGVSSTDIDFLASVRGRVGMAFDQVMIYGTGGIAWADASARARMVFDEDAGSDLDDVHIAEAKQDFDDIGFVAGAGLGWMVIPQTFSVGVEGLYYFFDENKTLVDETFFLENGDEVDVRATASLDDAWVIRARADFHF